MVLNEATINKLKVLIYEGKDLEAVKVLQKETNLSYKEAMEYVERLKGSLGKDEVRPAKNKSKLLLIVFASISGLFWVLAIYFYISKSDQIEQSVLIEGTVTEMIQNEDGSAPLVTYTYNEKEYQYWSSIYSNPPSYAVGEVVELYVMPEDPDKAILNSFTDRWLVIMIFGILAIVFDIIAVLVFFLKNTSSSSSTAFSDDDDGFSRDFD